jgi:hypothetical protein
MKVHEPHPTNIAHARGAWELNPQRLENGYDCTHQAPVVNGRYAPGCESHSESCCYGCQHHDEIPGIGAKVVERRRGDRLYTYRHPRKTGLKSKS